MNVTGTGPWGQSGVSPVGGDTDPDWTDVFYPALILILAVVTAVRTVWDLL